MPTSNWNRLTEAQAFLLAFRSIEVKCINDMDRDNPYTKMGIEFYDLLAPFSSIHNSHGSVAFAFSINKIEYTFYGFWSTAFWDNWRVG